MRRVLLLTCLLAGCGASTSSPAPVFWSLADLVRIATAGGAYVAHPDPASSVPMTAVVTPPGQDVYFRSPPFAPAASRNDGPAPQLNFLPGLAGGRFAPYITVEIWAHDFGDVWVQPMYRLVTPDGDGFNAVPDTKTVFSLGVEHRFYSPFWRVQYVLVPEAERDAVSRNPPKSVKEVLDLGYEIIDGSLVLCPIVPRELSLETGMARAAAGEERLAVEGFTGAILQAEYEPDELAKMLALRVNQDSGYVEGELVTTLGGFPADMYRELPGAVVEGNPIFMWVDVDGQGRHLPLGLPNVGAHGPLFSNRPLQANGDFPNWSVMWDVVEVVRPDGSQPFFPGPTTPGGTDPHEALRDRYDAPVPSLAVSNLPHVARYTGRLALNPECFEAEAPGANWADSCGFLDSQEKIEGTVSHDDFHPTGIRVLCPLLLWADVR